MRAVSTIEAAEPTAAAGVTSRLILRPIAAAGRRLATAVLASNARRAERQLARYLERSGGRLTDDIERRMFESLTTPNFRGW